MELPDIDPERMKAASDALDKAIKDGKTAAEARAAFEAVIKGGAAEPETKSALGPESTDTTPVGTAKPARKPRSDKGQSRKKAPPKPEELAAVASEEEPPAMTEPPRAARIGQLLLELAKELMS